MEIEVQLSRIAQAFERIAESLERVQAEGLTIVSEPLVLQGPLLVQHEFTSDALEIKGKFFLEPDEQEGFSVKLTK